MLLAVEVGPVVAEPGEAVGEQQVGVEHEAKAEQGVLQEVSVVEAEIEAVSLGRFAVANPSRSTRSQRSF